MTLFGECGLSTVPSGKQPGHEGRMQDNEVRVLKYYEVHPHEVGAEAVINATDQRPNRPVGQDDALFRTRSGSCHASPR